MTDIQWTRVGTSKRDGMQTSRAVVDGRTVATIGRQSRESNCQWFMYSRNSSKPYSHTSLSFNLKAARVMTERIIITGTDITPESVPDSRRDPADFDVTIGIDTDTPAFDDPGELARILRSLADTIDGTPDVTDYDGLALRDVNGNTVGTVYVR